MAGCNLAGCERRLTLRAVQAVDEGLSIGRRHATQLPDALAAGIDDLGGIDSIDVINPAYPQLAPELLAQELQARGWQLLPRTCVHERWWFWLPAPLRIRVEAVARRLTAGC